MRPILKGSTDQSVVIRIVDSADGTPETGVVYNTSGIDLWYRREGAAKTSITEATLSALTDAHSDGGILHIGDGYYRLDLPDAAVASGANGVAVGGTVTGMVVIGCYVPLTNFDFYDAVRGGLTALPNAAAEASGGLPTLSAAQASNGTINANVHRWLTGTPNALQSGRVDSYLGAVASAVIAAGSFAANALDAVWSTTTRVLTAGTNIALAKGTGVTGFTDMAAADVRTAVGLAAANLDTQLGTLATGSNLAVVAGYLDTEIAAIKAKTDNLPASPAATGDIPSAAAIADAVWDEAQSGHTTAGTFGKYLDAAVSGVSTGGVSAADIADAVWDEALAGHAGAGSAGAAVSDILTDTGTTLQGELDGIQSDTEDIQSRLPAALVSGRIDASVGAMATDTVTAAALAASAVSEIQSGLSTLDAAAVRTAVGLASANLDTQISTLATASNLATVAGYIDTEILAIKAKTDNLPSDPADQSAVEAAISGLLTTQMTESYNTDGTAPTLAQALFLIMQRLTEFSISGTTITVKKLDGSTAALTLTLDDATSPTSSTRS